MICSGCYHCGTLFGLDTVASNCRAPHPTVIRWGGPAWHVRARRQLEGGTLQWRSWPLPGRGSWRWMLPGLWEGEARIVESAAVWLVGAKRGPLEV